MMNNLFNSPLELGTRAVFILNSIKPQSANIDKIAYLDYVATYSSEFNGPSSLHPDVPLHHMEFIFRLDTLKSGINLMIKKNIINVEFSDNGIFYTLGENSYSFLSLLDNKYYEKLSDRCNWVHLNFSKKISDSKLSNLFGVGGTVWAIKK